MSSFTCIDFLYYFFFSSRRRHTRCALVTGVQTCALPIWVGQDRHIIPGERQHLVRPRQDRRPAGRLVEAENRREVAEGLAAPVGDIGFAHAGDPLQKLEDRGVVERLAGDPAACRPGRDDDARHTETGADRQRSEEHTSELKSLMRSSYAVFCLKKKK